MERVLKSFYIGVKCVRNQMRTKYAENHNFQIYLVREIFVHNRILFEFEEKHWPGISHADCVSIFIK